MGGGVEGGIARGGGESDDDDVSGGVGSRRIGFNDDFRKVAMIDGNQENSHQ
jgi:hypothetical protein